MNVELNVSPLCECGLSMSRDSYENGRSIFMCVNPDCEFYEVEYYAPTLELVPVAQDG